MRVYYGRRVGSAEPLSSERARRARIQAGRYRRRLVLATTRAAAQRVCVRDNCWVAYLAHVFISNSRPLTIPARMQRGGRGAHPLLYPSGQRGACCLLLAERARCGMQAGTHPFRGPPSPGTTRRASVSHHVPGRHGRWKGRDPRVQSPGPAPDTVTARPAAAAPACEPVGGRCPGGPEGLQPAPACHRVGVRVQCMAAVQPAWSGGWSAGWSAWMCAWRQCMAARMDHHRHSGLALPWRCCDATTRGLPASSVQRPASSVQRRLITRVFLLI
jgi:hypothetical protein